MPSSKPAVQRSGLFIPEDPLIISRSALCHIVHIAVGINRIQGAQAPASPSPLQSAVHTQFRQYLDTVHLRKRLYTPKQGICTYNKGEIFNF